MSSLTDSVWEYAKKNPYGFTLNILTMKPVKFGISVAFKETQNSHGKESLPKVIAHAVGTEKTVGGWLDSETDTFYFDSVKIFKNHQLKEAMEFAVENKQIAIFDLTNLKEIRL